jgi:hypothetical protein
LTIAEPMTVFTDYVLAGVTAWLCFLLLGSSRRGKSIKFWGVAFAALALGAFLGGTWHGFFQDYWLWKATVLAIGVASFGMLAGSACAVLSGMPRTVVLAFAAAKLAVFCVWIAGRDDFIVVVLDTGIAFVALAALHLWRLNGWILAGVAVSIVAALVQASGFALHAHFNHNDLYHVIQVGAMLLLYRGARRLSDATGPMPAPPAAGSRR